MGWRERNKPPLETYVVFHRFGWWGHWGGRKASSGSISRKPKTYQEIRSWDPEFCRGGRSPARVPTAYWDLPRLAQRSWKRHRGKQYKPIPARGGS